MVTIKVLGTVETYKGLLEGESHEIDDRIETPANSSSKTRIMTRNEMMTTGIGSKIMNAEIKEVATMTEITLKYAVRPVITKEEAAVRRDGHKGTLIANGAEQIELPSAKTDETCAKVRTREVTGTRLYPPQKIDQVKMKLTTSSHHL